MDDKVNLNIRCWCEDQNMVTDMAIVLGPFRHSFVDHLDTCRSDQLFESQKELIDYYPKDLRVLDQP